MTITQLIQSSPANANELFAKLAATSNGAVKTRESLFEQLKAELELHARLEEEHLFPVLKKHNETKVLVRSAVRGNKQTRALLDELDGMWKGGEEFLAKLEELRRAFQQHVRDERKELLPAVKTALTNEEAQAITANVVADKEAVEQEKRRAAEKRRATARRKREKVQAENAAVAAAKRQETEKRRTAARQEREKAEAEKAAATQAKRQAAVERRAAAQQEREKAERRRAQAEARQQRAVEAEKRHQAEIRAEERRVRKEEEELEAGAEAERRRAHETAEALAETGESLVRGNQAVAAAGGEAAQHATESVVENSQQFAGAVGDALGQTSALIARAFESYSDRARPTMAGLPVLASVAPVAAGAASETGKAWFELMKRTAESRTRSSLDLMKCATPLQAAEIQSRYAGETVQAYMAVSRRMLDISVEAYWGILKPLEGAALRSQARRTPDSVPSRTSIVGTGPGTSSKLA